MFAAVALLALPVTAAAQQPPPPPRDEPVVVTSGDGLEMVVTAGATSVGGVRFDLKDHPRLEREALRLAVTDARARAVAAAGGAGRSFDRIIRIEEQGVSSPPQPVLDRATLAAEQKSGEPPIASGQIGVRAHVTLTSILK